MGFSTRLDTRRSTSNGSLFLFDLNIELDLLFSSSSPLLLALARNPFFFLGIVLERTLFRFV